MFRSLACGILVTSRRRNVRCFLRASRYKQRQAQHNEGGNRYGAPPEEDCLSHITAYLFQPSEIHAEIH